MRNSGAPGGRSFPRAVLSISRIPLVPHPALRSPERDRLRDRRSDPPGNTHVTRRRLTEPPHGASIARRARAALLAAALSFVAVAPARTQELRFRQLTPDAGLSSSYVQSIFQDRTGFLWFGTDKGLDRYDGYVIHSYRHRRTDPHSIADGTIHVLHADRGDTMWVGTNVGLSRYDANQDAFINYAIGGGERTVHGIADDARGGLWIAADDGLYRFDRATGAATPTDGAASALLRGVPILALHTDRRGQLWIGTQTRGLVVLDPERDDAALRPQRPGSPLAAR